MPPAIVTEDRVKVLINEKQEHFWDTDLPLHCKTGHRLTEEKLGNCITKKFNKLYFAIFISLILHILIKVFWK